MPIDVTKLKRLAGVYEALRQRGHTSEQIADMTPDEAFDEACEWHSLPGWGPVLREFMSELKGAEIKPV